MRRQPLRQPRNSHQTRRQTVWGALCYASAGAPAGCCRRGVGQGSGRVQYQGGRACVFVKIPSHAGPPQLAGRACGPPNLLDALRRNLGRASPRPPACPAPGFRPMRPGQTGSLTPGCLLSLPLPRSAAPTCARTLATPRWRAWRRRSGPTTTWSFCRMWVHLSVHIIVFVSLR